MAGDGGVAFCDGRRCCGSYDPRGTRGSSSCGVGVYSGECDGGQYDVENIDISGQEIGLVSFAHESGSAKEGRYFRR